MFEIFKNQIQTKSMLKRAGLEINSNNWKEFKVNDLFIFERGERLVEIERIAGDIPFVAASFKNNGITSFISLDVYKDKKKVISK